jgi:uncharacterized paraquat-inducible protein A
MHRIYSANNLQEAYLIQGMLAGAGIETQILNEYAQGGLGEIPFTQAYPEIWLLNESDSMNAQKIIKQFEQNNTRTGKLLCKNCHESNPDTFETCWRCGAQLI